jgi:hypothetical protein
MHPGNRNSGVRLARRVIVLSMVLFGIRARRVGSMIIGTYPILLFRGFVKRAAWDDMGCLWCCTVLMMQ